MQHAKTIVFSAKKAIDALRPNQGIIILYLIKI